MRSAHGRVAESVEQLAASCTHVVVVLPVKRTAKLCVGVSLQHRGAHLVTAEWLKACEQAAAFVDPAPYLLKDAHASQPGAATAWQFNASESRKRAAAGRCLEGRSFYVTAATKPKPAEMKLIIEAAGGTVLGKAPTAAQAAKGAQAVVVSTEAEKRTWAPLAKIEGVQVIRAEHLLTCVLRQELAIGAGDLLV